MKQKRDKSLLSRVPYDHEKDLLPDTTAIDIDAIPKSLQMDDNPPKHTLYTIQKQVVSRVDH